MIDISHMYHVSARPSVSGCLNCLNLLYLYLYKQCLFYIAILRWHFISELYEIDCISNWRWHVETQQKTNQYPRQLWHWMSQQATKLNKTPLLSRCRKCREWGVRSAASRQSERNAFLNSVCHNLPDLQLMIFHLVYNTVHETQQFKGRMILWILLR